MNKRINELVEQAGLPVIDGEWDYNDREILCRENGEWRVATPTEIISVLFACEKGREKFAQLIAQECADICMEMYAKCAGLPGDGALAKDCAYWIKKDFGVE